MIMITDCWQGNVNCETEIYLHSQEELILAINSLNGTEKSTVCLELDFIHLMIAGGIGRQYVVTGGKNDKIYTLLGGYEGEDKFHNSMIIAGQYTPIEMKYCVDKTTALKAALIFYEINDFDKTLCWEII